jgi:hypothetical protein
MRPSIYASDKQHNEQQHTITFIGQTKAKQCHFVSVRSPPTLLTALKAAFSAIGLL